MAVEECKIGWGSGEVSALWHRAEHERDYVVLAHGAGGNMHTPSLAGFARTLASRGIGVVRFNFPYAEARKKAPDPQPRLEACYRSVADEVCERASRVFLGGRSMGGRIASHIVAEGYPADGLIFLGYPLHPPGKTERLRDTHLKKIRIPMLFIQGSKDPFARPDLLEETIGKLKAATLYVVQGGGHGLEVTGRKIEDTTNDVVDVILAWIRGTL